MNKLVKLFSKHENELKVLLIVYALYCSLIIGVSWDEQYYHQIGKINLTYLLSLGLIDEDYFSKYRYSTFYWSFTSLISQIVPQKFNIDILHIINTVFGLLTIIGLYQVVKKIFNKQVAKISSVLLFFTPFFFGHIAINNKDIILAFSYIWIIYYILKYSQELFDFKDRFLILLKLSALSALGTGIQLLFLGTLIPILIIFFVNIVFFKKRNFKLIFFDFLLYLVIFYTILLLFWVDAHENIFIQPFIFITKLFSESIGWPFNLINGTYVYSNNVPKSYLLINYFYKLPEFILLLYLLSVPFIIINFQKLKKEIKNFDIVFFSVLFLLFYPNLILFFTTFPIYDGIRLFMWSVPLLMIIPSLTLFLIFKNKNLLIKIILFILFFFHIVNFVTITPYHYTYLNIFSGKKNERYKKFENDYWSTSLKELIFSSNLKENKINFYTCGVNPEIAKNYMSQRYERSELTRLNEANYIIMTNRTLFSNKKNRISNCFEEYSSVVVHQVIKNGIVLSAIKKIKNE